MTAQLEQRVVLQAAAILLQYPDGTVRGRFATVRAALTDLAAGPAKDRLLLLLSQLEATSAAELETTYVATLDRKRRCCLYLTWWSHGETRRRGLALARLKQVYRDHGVELLPAELPDYLPVVLEFAATVDVAAGLQLLQEHRPGIELLRIALGEIGSPYVAAVDAVCALLPGPSPQDEEAARALARNGPPGEMVGLDGYGTVEDGLGPTSLMPTSPASAGGPTFIPLESLGVRR